MKHLVSKHKYLLLIFSIGLIVYFPIFFNGFVWDDLVFIIDNPQVHQVNLSLLGSNMFNSGPFYRPIPAIYFAVLYSIFNTHAFYYHAMQLSLHIIATCLLLVFFSKFFKPGIAFFLALLFLVHPIQAESVAFIGATQSELYFIPGIIALLLSGKRHLSRFRFLSITVLLFVCIMVKETGFLFILLVILYRYIFNLKEIKRFVLSAAVLIALYVLLRVFLAEVTYEMSERITIASLSLVERMLNIPAIIIYYLKTVLFPLHLAVWQMWGIRSLTLGNFVIPLVLSVSFFTFIFLIAYFLWKTQSKQNLQILKQPKHQKQQIAEDKKPFQQFAFFLLWFVLGLGLLLQLVPLDMTVADRWFYFPIVGLLGIIGVGLQALLASKWNHYKLFIGIAVIVLSLFSLRTFIRTFDYKDNITLYTHDLKEQNDNHFLIEDLADNLFVTGKIDEAIFYYKRAIAVSPRVGYFNELGLCYQAKKQFKEALASFKQAIQLSKTKQYQHYGNKKSASPYLNLAYTLLLDKRPHDAINFLNNQALKEFPDNSDLLTLLAISESQVNNHQDALKAITEAYKITQDENTTRVYMRIRNNMPITIGVD